MIVRYSWMVACERGKGGLSRGMIMEIKLQV
jgi:hypothetical protein